MYAFAFGFNSCALIVSHDFLLVVCRCIPIQKILNMCFILLQIKGHRKVYDNLNLVYLFIYISLRENDPIWISSTVSSWMAEGMMVSTAAVN